MNTSTTPQDPHEADVLTVDFEGRMLTVSQTTSGKVNASFDDCTQKFRYEVKEFALEKINYKTVLAAMKGTHPQIISAVFSQSEDDVHTLTIKVSYEYLPEIAESLVFEKREIPVDESEQAVIRGMRGHIRGIRDQINSIGTVQVLQGPLDETTDTQIFVKLCYQRTAFTWALNMRDMSTTIIKPQFYYYNSTTKQRKTSGAMPDDGLYVHQNGKGYVEVRFIAELEDFDMVVFSLNGKSTGEYTISSEKVTTLL